MDSQEENDEDEEEEDEGSPEDSSNEESDMEVESTTMDSKQSAQSTESADGEVPAVLDNTSSFIEPHQSSTRSFPSPGSQAEQYDFEISLQRALLQQKCVEVHVLKCVTLGPPGVGKSQLRKALTGSYEEVTESTPVSTGAEVIIEKYMDSEAMWKKFDLGDGQKALIASVREGHFAEMLPDSPHVVTRSQRHLGSRKQVPKYVKLVHNIVKARALCKKFRESREDMMKQLQHTDATDQKSLHKARIIHLIDSGGQPSFFDVHATLATSRAAYLQVLNLAEALDSKPQMSYRRPFPTKELNSPFRNIDFVARTLATLHDCKKKFLQMDEMIQTVMSGHKSNDLPIYLIGTHLDKALSTIENISSEIENECHTFPNWNEVVLNDNLSFHPVSCLAEGRAGIKALQRKISECRGGYPIRLPLSWFFVELMFWSEKGAGDGCMRYSELRDMCVQDKLLQSEDEFFTMVKLFHLLGLFIFPDLDRGLEGDKLDDFPVFTDPNFLFGEVSKVLDIQFRTGLSGSLKHLQETGILQEGALGDLGIPTSAGMLMCFHDWFKEFLIMWGLAADVSKRKGKRKAQKSEQAQELFIPSVLPPRPSARDVELDVDCSLLVAFVDEDDSRSYHIPQGIFSHFIARLVEDKKYTVAPDVYRDLVAFKNVCRERVTYTVKVLEKMDHLAFSLDPESPTRRSTAASYNAIRKELLQVLKTVWKRIYRGTPKLVVGFRCPCQGEEKSSQDHIAKYMEDSHELSCSSKLRDGRSMPASPNQLKWFGNQKVSPPPHTPGPAQTEATSQLQPSMSLWEAAQSPPPLTVGPAEAGATCQPSMSSTPAAADEAALKRLCWIPFDIKTVSIEAEGGILCLEPTSDDIQVTKEDTIFVEVPPDAVSTSADVKMRYAIIPSGPFTLPEGYQFGSPVVYIYYDGRRVTKPLALHLPHWHGGEDRARDGLSFAVAPHSFKGSSMYHFQLLAGGKFPVSSRYGVVEIGGHCSLFTKVFKLGTPVNCQAVCLEKEEGRETVCDIVVTYSSPYWLKILRKYRPDWKLLKSSSFKFKSDRITATLKQCCHDDWHAVFRGPSELPSCHVQYDCHSITSSKLLKEAVKESSYPPSITCVVTYNEELRSTGRPTEVGLHISGMDPKMEFQCTAYERIQAAPPPHTPGPAQTEATSQPQPSMSLWEAAPSPPPPTVGHTEAGATCQPSMSSTPAAAIFAQVIQDHTEEFLQEMNAKEIAAKLKELEVIPESVEFDIRQSKTKELANVRLLRHLKDDAAEEAVMEVFRIASEEKCYGRMNTFAAVVLKKLRQGKAVGSAGKENLPSSSSELPLHVSLSNSQPHTSKSQPPNFRRANTAGARIQSSARKGKQSSTKKGTKKRSRSLPDPSLPSLTKWFRPIHSHPDTQQLNGGSQTVGGQAAHHPSPLRPTHSSSSSAGILSGSTEEVTSALLSEPDDIPSDTDMSPPPAKKTKPTHSTSDPADST